MRIVVSRNQSVGRARAVLAAPALFLAGGSCAELTALDEYSVSSEPLCGAMYLGDCGGCVAEQCCAEADACASDPDCEPWGKCMGACGDDVTCKADCLAAHPKTDKAGRLLGCIVSKCHDRCSSCGDHETVFGHDCGRCHLRHRSISSPMYLV